MKTAKQHKADIDALTLALDAADRERDESQRAFGNAQIGDSEFWKANDRMLNAIAARIEADHKLAKARASFAKYVQFLRAEQRFLLGE